MDKKFNFKLDKDKIKLQLKDLGKRFVRRKGNFRSAFLLFMFFIIIGAGLVLYNRDNSLEFNNLSSESSGEEGQGVAIEYGVDEPSFYTGGGSGGSTVEGTTDDFSLNTPNLYSRDASGGDSAMESDNEIEGALTTAVKPVDQIRSEEPLELLRPVSGDIVQNPGWYYHPVLDDWRYQQGLEFSGNTGDVVMAAADGMVNSVLEDEYKGIIVRIEHENGWYTEYGHLQKTVVSPGSEVSRGQEIGRVGVTGMTTQPSLYFSLKNQDGAVDPVAYFE